MKDRITETVSETGALTDEQEEDGLRPGQEVVTFKHVCGACGHVVALHRHDFWVEADYQACISTTLAILSTYYSICHIGMQCWNDFHSYMYDVQEYRMDCRLCGTGDDSVSVMPRDPRKSAEW